MSPFAHSISLPLNGYGYVVGGYSAFYCPSHPSEQDPGKTKAKTITLLSLALLSREQPHQGKKETFINTTLDSGENPEEKWVTRVVKLTKSS